MHKYIYHISHIDQPMLPLLGTTQINISHYPYYQYDVVHKYISHISPYYQCDATHTFQGDPAYQREIIHKYIFIVSHTIDVSCGTVSLMVHGPFSDICGP